MIPLNLYRDVPVVTNYGPALIAIAYAIAWMYRDHRHEVERERMMDRLMSKDVREFKAISEKRKIEPQAWGQLDDETLADLESKRRDKLMAGE